MNQGLLKLVLCLPYFLIPQPLFADSAGGFCQNFELTSIPVGNFLNTVPFPLDERRLTQKYNTTYEEGWCDAPGQPPANSADCVGKLVFFGHDGLDLHPAGAKAGQFPVFAPQNGLVVASHWKFYIPGWGESVIIATRTNAYSEEIVTFHLHHLHAGGSGRDDYWTTRLVNPCDTVMARQELAREGGTSNWPTHLHVSFKRWKNITELKNLITQKPEEFYGYGYVSGNAVLLTNFLDPEGYFFGYFNEFAGLSNLYPDWQWAAPYVLLGREMGWEFGLYDGRFGVSQNVKKREISRWLKIALEIPSISSGDLTFWDVNPTDPDYVYIDSLLKQYQYIPIINPWHSCTETGMYFCPDAEINRAEALKMIVAAFFQTDFLQVYNNWIWKTSAPLASKLLTSFTDVDPTAWYAPYVYYGMLVDLVQMGGSFNPAATITRGELFKWLTLGYENRYFSTYDDCSGVTCPAGFFCDRQAGSCQPIPTCIPTENSPCPLGGGWEEPPDPSNTPDAAVLQSDGGISNNQQDAPVIDANTLPIGPDAAPIAHQDANTAIQQDAPKPPQQDAAKPPPVDAPSPPAAVDAALPSCPCTSGVCCNGCNFLPSGQVCSTKTEYHCAGLNPGDNVEYRTRSSTCSGYSADCDGYENIGSWQVYQDCTSQEICTHPVGQNPICQKIACTDQYFASPATESCYNNPSSSGSPTICLETQQISGPSWQYRFCKKGSTFSQNIHFILEDQNHSYHFLDSGDMNFGVSCSPWRSVDFSYLNQTGSINGAGLRVVVLSPYNCSSPACNYYSGLKTLYKNCL